MLEIFDWKVSFNSKGGKNIDREKKHFAEIVENWFPNSKLRCIKWIFRKYLIEPWIFYE